MKQSEAHTTRVFCHRGSDHSYQSPMDPHSRFSHFNSRQTKAGPLASSSRFMDPAKLPISLDGFTSKKGSRTPSTSKKPSSAAQATLYVERPIVTNSRIKQGVSLVVQSMWLPRLTWVKMSNIGRTCTSPS